jgi:PAS domain S-box-containing protein
LDVIKNTTTTKAFTPVIALVLIIFVALIFLSFRQTSELKATAALVAHTQEVIFHTASLSSRITDIETGTRGFLLTGQGAFLEPQEKSKLIIYKEIDELKQLTKDNSSQQLLTDSLLLYVKKKITFSDSSIALRKGKGMQAAILLVGSGGGKWYMDNIRRFLTRMQNAETSVLEQRKTANEKATALLDKIIGTIIIIILLLIGIFLRKTHLDITAQKKAEQNLEKSEERFGLLVSNVKDYSIVMLDPDGRIISWNSGAENIKGYQENEIIGKSFELFYTEEDARNGEPYYNLEMAREYGHFEKEGRRIKKDGSQFWANVVLTALKDEQGKLYGYSKITRDVTERKKNQEQLEFLSRQINQSNDSIYTVDTDLKIKSWNKGAENLYGFTQEEVLGKDPNTVLKTTITNKELDAAIETMAENDYWTGELQRQTKTGTAIYVHSSSSTVRDSENKITGYVAVSFDITAQKKLREQVNYLASIVEQSAEAIFSRGLDRKFISWNKGAEKLYGYSSEEVIGKTAAELGLTRLTNEEILALEKQLMETGRWEAEMNYYHKDGSVFFGAATGSSIKNEKGEEVSFNFIVKDISVRKQLEDQLKKSNEELEKKIEERTQEIYKNEKRFRALIENNSDIISLLDKSFRVFYRSPSASRIMGWTNEETAINDNKESIHPDDAERIENMIQELIKNPGKPVNGLFRKLHKQKHYVWLEGIAVNLLHDENVKAIVFNFRDVTGRMEAEAVIAETLKEKNIILESIGDAFFAVDKNWTVTYWNRVAETALGVLKQQIVGKHLWDIFSDSVDSLSYKKYAQAIATSQVVHFEDYYNALNKWYEISAYPSENGLSVYFKDITERKKTQQEILELNTRLEEKVTRRTKELLKANEEMEAFSYSVSHDLRAPLRAIIGFTAILEEDYSSKLDAEAQRITSIIKKNTLKMGHLIDDLLTFSRMGRQDIIKTTIDNNNLVSEIIGGMDNNGHAHSIEWAIHTLPCIKADINTIRQVWVNLISNAVKYSSNTHHPKIEIGSLKHKGQTAFFIKDNGVGFDEKYKNKLFKVFQRLHSAEEFEGTGIGLAIVEKVVSKHGGKVWAEAEVNKGAEFYFSLPENDEQIV